MPEPTDYCAGCGKPLTPAQNGGRLYCCSRNYWSQHQPLPADQRGFYKMTGDAPIVQLSEYARPPLRLYYEP